MEPTNTTGFTARKADDFVSDFQTAIQERAGHNGTESSQCENPVNGKTWFAKIFATRDPIERDFDLIKKFRDAKPVRAETETMGAVASEVG